MYSGAQQPLRDCIMDSQRAPQCEELGVARIVNEKALRVCSQSVRLVCAAWHRSTDQICLLARVH
jgi:hypothetical protein